MTCIYCNREIENKGSLSAHQLTCKSNPNKVKFVRSKNAGRKKGSTPWNKGVETGAMNSWLEKFPDELVFAENSSYNRNSIKRRILKNNLIDYNCSICKTDPEWMGKPMVLILDHINGVNNDNRIDNLRFVCSNCDSQLDTYKSKNKNNAQRK